MITTKKTHVLFFFDSTEMKNSQKTMLELINSLRQTQFSFRILLPSSSGEIPNYLRSQGLEFDVLALPQLKMSQPTFFSQLAACLISIPKLLRYYRKLFRYCMIYEFEVVHADGKMADLLSVGLKMRFNVPLIWNLSFLLPVGSSLSFFKILASIFSDAILACSLFAGHQLGRSLRWRHRLTVIYRGFDLKKASDDLTDISNMKVTIGAVAGPGEKIFLRAMELVHRKGAGHLGVIFSSDSEPSELTRLISELRISDVVHVEKIPQLGPHERIGKYLRAKNISTFVSVGAEPVVFDPHLVEAMGVGIPVVAARTGVFPELVIHEMTGLLVTAGDANALAEALGRLAEDQVLCGKLASNARYEFETRFGFKRYFAVMDRLDRKFISRDELRKKSDDQGGKAA